jgi:PD-(D/E)XK nuclease superfamily
VLTATDLRNFPAVADNIERPDTLSQTLLGKHDSCPRSAYLSRKYETSSIAMDRGTAFHLVAERATEMMLEAGEQTMPGEVAKELADAVMAEHPELVLPTESQDAVRLMAWNWAEGTVLDPSALIGVELRIRFEVGGFALTCRIDRAEVFDSTLHLHDYKTSLNMRKREDVQRGFQGQFYALAALRGEVVPEDETLEPFAIGSGINDVWFWETYPRYRDEDSGQLIAKDGSWTRPELHEFATSLERNVEIFESSLESGEWPARDGSWCSQCAAPAECPIPEHLRAVEEVTSPEHASDLFSLKLAHERHGRRMQATLRGWAKENGPVFQGDYVFDGQLQRSKEVVDWGALLHAIYQSTELGVPLKLDDHIRVKESTMFGKRKLTEEERDG